MQRFLSLNTYCFFFCSTAKYGWKESLPHKITRKRKGTRPATERVIPQTTNLSEACSPLLVTTTTTTTTSSSSSPCHLPPQPVTLLSQRPRRLLPPRRVKVVFVVLQLFLRQGPQPLFLQVRDLQLLQRQPQPLAVVAAPLPSTTASAPVVAAAVRRTPLHLFLRPQPRFQPLHTRPQTGVLRLQLPAARAASRRRHRRRDLRPQPSALRLGFLRAPLRSRGRLRPTSDLLLLLLLRLRQPRPQRRNLLLQPGPQPPLAQRHLLQRLGGQGGRTRPAQLGAQGLRRVLRSVARAALLRRRRARRLLGGGQRAAEARGEQACLALGGAPRPLLVAQAAFEGLDGDRRLPQLQGRVGDVGGGGGGGRLGG
eukprot:Rhum_TRINITY_DN14259_c2_g2::Rhum_TRINITY_DN14259_c2_g2_i1::g.77964::m.77964